MKKNNPDYILWASQSLDYGDTHPEEFIEMEVEFTDFQARRIELAAEVDGVSVETFMLAAIQQALDHTRDA